MSRRFVSLLAILAALAMFAVACGGDDGGSDNNNTNTNGTSTSTSNDNNDNDSDGPATLASIAAPEGATELDPNVAKTLGENNAASAILSAQLGTGGNTEQKGYNLPADAEWDSIKGFYDGEFDDWDTNSQIESALAAVNSSNPLFKIANWQKDGQNVSVIMITDPVDATKKQLIVSLHTN